MCWVRRAKCVFVPRILLRLPLSGVPACYRGARARAAIRIDSARGRSPEQCRNDGYGRAIRTARTINRDAAVGPLPAGDLATRALELDRDGIRLDAGSLRDAAVVTTTWVPGYWQGGAAGWTWINGYWS